jgi:hypothetical protein
MTKTYQTQNPSDRTLAALLKRLRTTTDIAEIRLLSERIEGVLFHKQFRHPSQCNRILVP